MVKEDKIVRGLDDLSALCGHSESIWALEHLALCGIALERKHMCGLVSMVGQVRKGGDTIRGLGRN